MEQNRRRTERAAGFTLIELLVVVLIIGVLASIAVPAFFRAAEKGRFAEAMTCLSVVKAAQARYQLKTNTYTTSNTDLDTPCAALIYFSAPAWTAASSVYTATLTRIAPLPGTYMGYTVTFIGPAGALTCSQTNCSIDLLP
jgi:type IV pilus assembly protein PilE